MNLLYSSDDWDKFRLMHASLNGLQVKQVPWGDGPKSYPCLAAATFQKQTVLEGVGKMITFYVYIADARKLIEASGEGVSDGAEGGGSGQSEFNQATLAHLMTIIELMRDTGLMTEEQYEVRYIRLLADADRMGAEAIDQFHRKKSEASDKDDSPPDPEDDFDEDPV
jgi:hypothetical protein